MKKPNEFKLLKLIAFHFNENQELSVYQWFDYARKCNFLEEKSTSNKQKENKKVRK